MYFAVCMRRPIRSKTLSVLYQDYHVVSRSHHRACCMCMPTARLLFFAQTTNTLNLARDDVSVHDIDAVYVAGTLLHAPGGSCVSYSSRLPRCVTFAARVLDTMLVYFRKHGFECATCCGNTAGLSLQLSEYITVGILNDAPASVPTPLPVLVAALCACCRSLHLLPLIPHPTLLHSTTVFLASRYLVHRRYLRRSVALRRRTGLLPDGVLRPTT